jgi:predicted nucleic acid-binding protein
VKVVDSSVILDLMTSQLHPARLGDEELAAPHLIDTEVLHVLRRLCLLGQISEDDAVTGLDLLDELVLARYPTDLLRRRIWDLRHNLTAYDATYVALTELLNATSLLTKDTRIARAPGIRCAVEVL